MNRDPFNQRAVSGASTYDFNAAYMAALQSEPSSSSSHPPSAASLRASSRASPTAILTLDHRPSTFATASPPTTAPTPVPATTAPMSTTASIPVPPMLPAAMYPRPAVRRNPSTFATASPPTTAPTPVSATTAPMTTTASIPLLLTHHLARFIIPDPDVHPQYSTPPTMAADDFERNSIVTLYIQGLDANATQHDLDLLLMAFSDRVLDYEFIRCGPRRFHRTARVRTNNSKAAHELRGMLHNKKGMTVDIVEDVRPLQSSGPSSQRASPATPPERFDALCSSDYVPTSNNYSVRNGNGHALVNPRGHFATPSPIRNGVDLQPRVSGKALINDANEEDELERDMLRLASKANPCSNTNARADYSNNGPPVIEQHDRRRATAPHLLPIAQMGGLSLNNGPNGMSAARHGNPDVYAYPNAMSPTSMSGSMAYSHHANRPAPARENPPANKNDNYPPCNTLYVGNLPMGAREEEIKRMFSAVRGYKRMCYRVKGNGPMCFVEFEDIPLASRAINITYGLLLSNSTNGGMRVSFSKNPLGVRAHPPNGHGPVGGGHHGMVGHGNNGFAAAAAAGPPPGLDPYPQVPPGLGPNPPYGSALGTNNISRMTDGYSYAAYGNGNNGPNMPNGSFHAAYGNDNNGLGTGLGNGTNFDRSREPRGNPWPQHSAPQSYAASQEPYSSTYTPALPVAGNQSFGSNRRGGGHQAPS